MPPISVRVDKLLLGLAEHTVKKGIEPRLGNAPLWEGGLGAVIETALNEGGVSSQELTMVDLARKVGILKRGPRGVR